MFYNSIAFHVQAMPKQVKNGYCPAVFRPLLGTKLMRMKITHFLAKLVQTYSHV